MDEGKLQVNANGGNGGNGSGGASGFSWGEEDKNFSNFQFG